jgi:DNA-binding response OmpR family regulator
MYRGRAARILIIDDEPELRELLSDALSSGETTVQVAASGKEAMDVARAQRPDIVIADLQLGDCSGLEVIDQLRQYVGDVPAVVITGHGDTASLTEASQRRPLELMTKPLDLDRLRHTISEELDRRATTEQEQTKAQTDLQNTVADLTCAYRGLSEQMLTHQRAIQYQLQLVGAKNDDDVFRAFFRTFVREGGAVYGAALVCDSNAELRVTGRFGVPRPDGLEFCKRLTEPLIDILLADPHVRLVDAGADVELFDDSIRRYLPGINILVVPLIPAAGEMIGMVALYRKGEQPFGEEELNLAKIMAYPTAVAVRRND